jgi:hypothetical protein
MLTNKSIKTRQGRDKSSAHMFVNEMKKAAQLEQP